MNDDLLAYYEEELRYFRRLGAEFAEPSWLDRYETVYRALLRS